MTKASFVEYVEQSELAHIAGARSFFFYIYLFIYLFGSVGSSCSISDL